MDAFSSVPPEAGAKRRKEEEGGAGSRRAKKAALAAAQRVRVVHFSDPIYVTTTVGEFKIRVQELTGRSSTVADGQLLEEGAAPGSGLPSDLGLDDVDDCGLFDVSRWLPAGCGRPEPGEIGPLS